MVSPALQSDILIRGRDGQQQNDKSNGEAFQLQLDETAINENTSEPESLSDHDYGGQTFVTSVSTALWQMEIKQEPETIEERQKKLDAASTALADEFMEFSKMSASEKIRALILGDKNLTEDQLAAMAPEERAAIEEEIKQAILRALGVEEAKNEGGATKATTASAA